MIALFADTPERKALRDSRAGAARLFGEFGVRLFVFLFDFFFLVLIAHAFAYLVTTVAGVHENLFPHFFVALAPFYFALSWWSPMRATPMQWLFGLRIVDVHANGLTLARSLARMVVMFAIAGTVLFWFDAVGRDLSLVLAGVGCIAGLLAALTPNRQGAHDLIAGSIVVNKRMLKSESDWQYVEEIASQNTPAARRAKRPTIARMISNSIAMGVAVFVLVSVSTVAHDKELRARAGYAMSETHGLRTAVAEFYLFEDRWPAAGDDVGADTRGDYPDGGYYELSEKGIIQIHFTKNPELMRGHLEMVPVMPDGQIEWQCRMQGSISRRYLPAMCRNGD